MLCSTYGGKIWSEGSVCAIEFLREGDHTLEEEKLREELS